MQIVPSTRETLQVTLALLEIFLEKNMTRPQKSKNVSKTTKIEGYIHAFRLSGGASSKRQRMTLKGMRGHLK